MNYILSSIFEHGWSFDVIWRLWRHVTRALAGYPSPISGDDAKYQIENAARKRSQEMAVEKTTWTPEFFLGDVFTRLTFKYEMVWLFVLNKPRPFLLAFNQIFPRYLVYTDHAFLSLNWLLDIIFLKRTILHM